MLCSMSGASQFDMDSGTKTAGSSLFSHGLKITVVFAAFPNVVPARRITPGVPVPVGARMRHFAGGHIPFGRSFDFQGSGVATRTV